MLNKSYNLMLKCYTYKKSNSNIMKTRNIFVALALSLIMGGSSLSSAAQNRIPVQIAGGGPGIAVAASQNSSKLPKTARSFIQKNFKGVNVTKCVQYFAKNKYEVELSNGVDIDFDNNGKVVEIKAPGRSTLAPSVVKNLLHKNAYRRLEKDGLASKVESIEFKHNRKNVEVELSIPGPDTYIFDINGTFIAITD